MKPYRELTRRGRLSRLRELANSALVSYGLEGARLTFLQYFSNIIYRVDVPDSSDQRASGPYIPNRYVLRIHAMDDEDAIVSELTWLKALDQEAGLPVPAPVLTLNGKLLAKISNPGVPNGRVISLMRWLDGRKLQRGLRPQHLNALGQVVAFMHNFSASWNPPVGFSRPHWDWEAQLGGIMFEHSMEELIASMPPRIQEPFQVVSQKARQVMEALGKGPDAYGLIHADLYAENVLYKGGIAYPIDFEDCGYGYWMDDIAVVLCQWAWGTDWQRMCDAFREGYDQVRRLLEEQWEKLDLFVATQFATMVLWASEFIKHDPMRQAEHGTWREDSVNKLLQFVIAAHNDHHIS
jgi:Ser/Thr protein kinase RdoA (MazF antagonist)